MNSLLFGRNLFIMKNKILGLRLTVVAVVLTVLLGGVSISAASKITEDLKSTIDNVIAIVTNPQYKSNKSARRAKIRQLIDARFSYEQMGMRSLAKEWDKRSSQEKTKFVDLFGQLLENSYANKIESFSDEKINYVDEIVKGKYAMVKTQIVRKDATIDVDYKLIRLGGEWRVYDFVIEGVSMIRNYRSQFTKIIRKDSFSGLVDKMTTKINNLKAQESQTGTVTETDQL